MYYLARFAVFLASVLVIVAGHECWMKATPWSAVDLIGSILIVVALRLYRNGMNWVEANLGSR